MPTEQDINPEKKENGPKKNLYQTDPESQVRETEDASLPDDSYSFDESNTDLEEYHDVSDSEEFDIERDEGSL